MLNGFLQLTPAKINGVTGVTPLPGSMSPETPASMMTIYVAEQKPYETLYVPAGYIVAEQAHTGGLLYGTRKSVVAATEDNISAYSGLVSLYEKSGKEVGKMKKVLEAMRAVHATSAGSAQARD